MAIRYGPGAILGIPEVPVVGTAVKQRGGGTTYEHVSPGDWRETDGFQHVGPSLSWQDVLRRGEVVVSRSPHASREDQR